MKWWLVGAAVVVALVAGSVVWGVERATGGAILASTQQREHPAADAEPGAAGEWRSADQTVGAWIARSWDAPVDVRRVVLQPGGSGGGLVAGYLRFSDGSRQRVQLGEGTTIVPVAPRRVTSVRFTVSEVEDGATSVSLGEFDADDEDAPAGEVALDAPEDGDVAADASGLADAWVDDDSRTSATVDDGALEATWATPRELERIAITGSATGPAMLSGMLQFSDGSTVPVGEVTADTDRPTTVAFMPRAVTSVRLTVDDTSADGDVALGGFAAYQRGAQASGPSTGDPTNQVGQDQEPLACERPGPRPSDETGVVVWCPTNGSVVDDQVQVSLAAGPSYSTVGLQVWSAQPGSADGASLAKAPLSDLDATGSATVDLDVTGLDPGPFTVAVTAFGDAVDDTTAHLQLVMPGELPSDDVGQPGGRTLVYEDGFDTPLSINRTGEDADYVAGKPESWGVTDFGAAIFADPQDGYGNMASSDGYLRMSVSPRPEELTDPNGWGREHVGAMLASARSGGSGFSAQYGYFEARMLAPGEPGTWPAFWLLSNPELVQDEPVAAEIDAVELYGHDPDAACHTSHQYPDPEEIGEASCGQRFSSVRDAMQWHVYGVDVRPDRIVYYIDGQRVADAPPVGVKDEPMFFMLDLALGGGWPVDLSSTRDRADLFVDWVRVYV